MKITGNFIKDMPFILGVSTIAWVLNIIFEIIDYDYPTMWIFYTGFVAVFYITPFALILSITIAAISAIIDWFSKFTGMNDNSNYLEIVTNKDSMKYYFLFYLLLCLYSLVFNKKNNVEINKDTEKRN